MKLNSIRSILYKTAKLLGDVQAGSKAISKGSFMPIVKRLLRRIYGNFTSRGFKFFK